MHIEDRTIEVDVEDNVFVQCGKDQFSTIQIITDSKEVRVRRNKVDGTGTHNGLYIAAIAALGGGGALPTNVLIEDNEIACGTYQGVYHQVVNPTIRNNKFSPAVRITNGGSSGTQTVTGNTVL